MEFAYWWNDYGHAESPKQPPPLITGSRRLLQARNCGNGSITGRSVGVNFKNVTGQN